MKLVYISITTKGDESTSYDDHQTFGRPIKK